MIARRCIWMDNKDAPSTGWTSSGPFHQELSSTTPVRWDTTIVHDPLNSVIWEFGGNVALSPVNSISVYAQGSTAFCGGAAKTLCAITPNTSINPLPLIQEQIGGFFDYYYSDHNPGEARVCWLGGYIYNGSSYVQQPGINCFYPNGSVAKGLPALSWGVTTGNGEAGNSGPLRDRKSTRLNSSHLGISYAVFCLKKKDDRHTDPLDPVPEVAVLALVRQVVGV